MPLINGQKMACEPCIRGHRSTKCTHANERLMVPVRKPGRPLSACPHPSAQPCSCAAVTAAIPRKQKCNCGGSQPAPVHVKHEEDAAGAGGGSTTPPSFSKPSAVFRVQKSGLKAALGKKPSIDATGLERMDASQLNVLPMYGAAVPQPMAMPGAVPAPISDMPMYGSLRLTPTESRRSPDSALFPIFPFSVWNPPISGPLPETAAAADQSTNLSTRSSAPPTSAGCCGGRSNGTNGNGNLQASMSVPAASGHGGAGAKSCCSTTTTTTTTTTTESRGLAPKSESMPPLSPTGLQSPTGIMGPPTSAHLTMSSGGYPYYSQPTIFSYPPQFGSFLQPLQPEQWRDMMTRVNYEQPMAAPNPPAFEMPPAPGPGVPNDATWTSHQCTCGPSCQCIGCAAHPYNNATQNYVRSAWSTMMEDEQNMHPPTNGRANVGMNLHQESFASRTSSGRETPAAGLVEGGIASASPPQTPSDASTAAPEEQTLSASDYFFVSYPFRDSCAGDTSNCPCGDDCQCIGCIIHGSGRVP
ncbi:hypothetical protein DCS_06888 [Drechmeria coniospora]|uniref:Copper-fist domain-containing protein n=1 Tax=Drechmeria coniospora TaxID=98403 RepID=A0A151GCT6_DRECN|nr:hypothetical protein DCS_06888 [Drechmeria coniospora]KYK54927.1 hypothetical protein DCS_06888 [Drechmeria coniospora]